jgi:phage shock protein C
MNRLHRSKSNKIVGGVCGGLAEYLHVDPLILRILFAVLAMANGIGFVVYVLLWVLMPVADVDYESQQDIMHHNIEEIGERARTLGQEARGVLHGRLGAAEQPSNRMLIGGVILAGAGLLLLLENLGLLWWFNLGKLWPLLLIAIGGVILLNNLKGQR